MNDRNVSADEAKRIGDKLGVNWAKIDPGHFQRGLDVEFGHGMHDPGSNAIDYDVAPTGKIAWARLEEFPEYHTRLTRLEGDADAYRASRH